MARLGTAVPGRRAGGGRVGASAGPSRGRGRAWSNDGRRAAQCGGSQRDDLAEVIRIVNRHTVQLVAHRSSSLYLYRESVRRLRPRDRRLRAFQELLYQVAPLLLVLRRGARVVVAGRLIALEDGPLVTRRMPQLFIDRVRRAGGAKCDLLEGEPGQQVLAGAKLAGQEQVLPDTHRRAPLLLWWSLRRVKNISKFQVRNSDF